MDSPGGANGQVGEAVVVEVGIEVGLQDFRGRIGRSSAGDREAASTR